MQPLSAAIESRRFGKYTLIAKLAQGGMAEIFLARLGGAAGFEKLVCIKRILPSYAEDEAFVSMFLDEAKIAARISHPNVCQVFELGSVDGQYFIAMEYLEGIPVSTLRHKERYPPPPDPRLVVGIAMQACEGLHHAHQLRGPDGQALGVVHRDISPQNLFITADGIVKVLDFGIAKVHNASQKTTTGTVKGTYAYMPPEQLRGEGVDRRSDVFAMGAVLWEVLARRHLFRRETDFLTFQAITTDPLPDVCAYRPDVPLALGAVITRALSRDREERWPSARAFGEALFQASLPLGGPLAPAPLGEEVVRAFGASIEEQRVLLEAARAGGEFDLEESTLSPQGALDLPTTPASGLRRRSEPVRVPAEPEPRRSSQLSAAQPRRSSQQPAAAPPRRSSQLPAEAQPRRSSQLPVEAQPRRSSQLPVEAHPRRSSQLHAEADPRYSSQLHAEADPRYSSQLHAEADPRYSSQLHAEHQRYSSQLPIPQPLPAALTRSRIWLLVALVLLAGSVGGGAVYYFFVYRQKPPAPALVAAKRGSAAPAGSPAAAPAALATPAAAPADAALPDAAPEPRDAAVIEPPRPPRPTPATAPAPAPRPAPPPPPAAGPPGSITIDSAPMYAVIFIDGKRYGETPLIDVKLPPGKHAVRAVSPSGGTQSLTITIEAGKKARGRRIEW